MAIRSSKLSSFLKVLFAGGILYWLVHSGYLGLADLKRALDPLYLPLTFLCVLGMLVCAAERFRYLLIAQGVHLDLKHNFEIFFIGHFFNFVIPGGVGGDVVKAYYIHKDVGDRAKTSPYTVLFDRFIGFLVLATMAMVVIACEWARFQALRQLHTLEYVVIAMFVVLWLFVVVGFWAPARHFIMRLIPERLGPAHKFAHHIVVSCDHYSRQPKSVLFALAYGVLGQVFAIFALMTVSAAVRIEPISLSAFFFVGPLGYVVTSLPISVAGIGVGQAAFLFFFNIYLGHHSSIGPVVITIVQVTSFFWSLIGLVLYLARRGPRQLPQQPIAG